VSIYKRDDSPNYWVNISIPGRRPVQKRTWTANRKLAQGFHDSLKVQLWRQSMLGEQRTYLWEEAVTAAPERNHPQRDHKGDKARLRWLHPRLEDLALTEITRDRMDEIMAAKAHRRPGTINRTLATVRAILRKASREWGWIDAYPALNLRREPAKRVRWIMETEAARLLAALPPASVRYGGVCSGKRPAGAKRARADLVAGGPVPADGLAVRGPGQEQHRPDHPAQQHGHRGDPATDR